jgi:outer membrane immunogenic protein
MRRLRWLTAPVVGLATIAAIPTLGADLYTKAPSPVYAPPPSPPFSWTGFYIGANLGVVWENLNITDELTGATLGSRPHSAFPGGGQAGLNYQVGPYFVLGVEGFFDGIASNNNTGPSVVIPTIGLATASAQPDWISTLAGRIGFTGPGFDHVLFYAKGGGAWAQTSETLALPAATFTGSRTGTGWMLGGGVEWTFVQNWALRVDYQFIQLENATLDSGFMPADSFTLRNADVQTLTVGINYSFNDTPRH